jgi:acetyl esterase/lipase
MIRRVLLPAGLLLAAVLAGCSTAPANVPFPLGTAHRNLTYCHSQTLDLYIPRAAATRPLPVAMYVHGGGMTAGDKSDLNPVFLDALASAGYAVASVNYRLAPQFKFPAQIEDVTCAIRYLRAKAPRYGLNGSEIFAFGTSVGGQLVALAALSGPHSAFDAGPYAAEPSSLTAVADMFGPANLTEPASGFSPSGIQGVFGTNDHRDLVLASPRTSSRRTRRPSSLFRASTTRRFSSRSRSSSTGTSKPQVTGLSLSWCRTWATCSRKLARSPLTLACGRSRKTS